VQKGRKAERREIFRTGDIILLITTKEMHRVNTYSGVFEIGGAFLDGQRV